MNFLENELDQFKLIFNALSLLQNRHKTREEMTINDFSMFAGWVRGTQYEAIEINYILDVLHDALGEGFKQKIKSDIANEAYMQKHVALVELAERYSGICKKILNSESPNPLGEDDLFKAEVSSLLFDDATEYLNSTLEAFMSLTNLESRCMSVLKSEQNTQDFLNTMKGILHMNKILALSNNNLIDLVKFGERTEQ